MKVRFILFILFLLEIMRFSAIFPRPASAQLPDFSITSTYTINDPDLEDGDIVSLNTDNSTLGRSTTAYDEAMHGVYVENPKIVYRAPNNDYPVARNGEVQVNVTTLNGEIAVGEYISSSPIPGKGQKATEYTGYMLGVALSPFTAKDGVELVYNNKTYRQGQIKVAVGIGPASASVVKSSGGLLGTIRYLGSTFVYNLFISKQADKTIRILLAVLIAVSSVGLSIHFFGKNVTKGIESIGRNPLAQATIQRIIFINIALISGIALSGIIIALIIISI